MAEVGLFAPVQHRSLRPPTCTPPVTRRLRRRRDPSDPALAGELLYLPWWQVRVVLHEPADAGGWLCSYSHEQGAAGSSEPLLHVYPEDVATGISYADYPLSAEDLLSVWQTVVEARCGAVRDALATALAEAADPVGLTVRIDYASYKGHLMRRSAIRSYGGFWRAVGFLQRAGLVVTTDDPHVIALSCTVLV